jgi:hypothetical protein
MKLSQFLLACAILSRLKPTLWRDRLVPTRNTTAIISYFLNTQYGARKILVVVTMSSGFPNHSSGGASLSAALSPSSGSKLQGSLMRCPKRLTPFVKVSSPPWVDNYSYFLYHSLYKHISFIITRVLHKLKILNPHRNIRQSVKWNLAVGPFRTISFFNYFILNVCRLQ